MVDLFSLSDIRLGTVQLINDDISIPAFSKLKYARCTCCNTKSKCIHSSYVRVLRDLSISNHCVSINMTVRKFFCKNPVCERKIFTEQPGSQIKAYSRMTYRAREMLQNIFLEVSARKGAYIAGLISVPVSSSTALRMIDSLPIPSIEKVTILGIDDWAYRKGISYGTILVDIEKRRVIDLLHGRDGAYLRTWLKEHPEIKVVTRDRASAYSCAVSETLPNTIQVADRFHLLKNLSDSVYEVIRNEYRNFADSLNEGKVPPLAPYIETRKIPRIKKTETNGYSKERFEKVKRMLKNGLPMRLIAKSLNMSRVTVSKYSKMDSFQRKSIHPLYNYNEYQEIIEKGFSEGKVITEIFINMQNAGFKGSRSGFYKQFRDHPIRTNPGETILLPTKHQLISPRKIARYLRIADLSKIKSNSDRKLMTALLSKNPLLETLRHQIISFKELLLGNDRSLLEDWMKRTLTLGKAQLKTFVRGLESDIEAVKNAIETNWSNGQVEGQVNRLKSIKRQMYGRAGFDHLRRKVMLSKSG